MVDAQDIFYDGRLAAWVTRPGIVFATWVDELDHDDPVWRFICAASVCAFDVLNGLLTSPYNVDVATAYARGAFVGATRFDATRPNRLSPQFPPFIVREL